MNLSVIQIVLIVFAAFALFKTAMQFRSRRIPFVWAASLSLSWIVLGTVAFLPKTTDLLAASVGIGRGADLLVYLAIVGLVYIVFRLIMKLQKLERDVTKLVRHSALKDLEDKD